MLPNEAHRSALSTGVAPDVYSAAKTAQILHRDAFEQSELAIVEVPDLTVQLDPSA